MMSVFVEESKSDPSPEMLMLRRSESQSAWLPKAIMVKIYMYVLSYEFKYEFFTDREGHATHKSVVTYRLISRRWNQTVCQAFEFLT
jgi:hypothetical protein